MSDTKTELDKLGELFDEELKRRGLIDDDFEFVFVPLEVEEE